MPCQIPVTMLVLTLLILLMAVPLTVTLSCGLDDASVLCVSPLRANLVETTNSNTINKLPAFCTEQAEMTAVNFDTRSLMDRWLIIMSLSLPHLPCSFVLECVCLLTLMCLNRVHNWTYTRVVFLTVGFVITVI